MSPRRLLSYCRLYLSCQPRGVPWQPYNFLRTTRGAVGPGNASLACGRIGSTCRDGASPAQPIVTVTRKLHGIVTRQKLPKFQFMLATSILPPISPHPLAALSPRLAYPAICMNQFKSDSMTTAAAALFKWAGAHVASATQPLLLSLGPAYHTHETDFFFTVQSVNQCSDKLISLTSRLVFRLDLLAPSPPRAGAG